MSAPIRLCAECYGVHRHVPCVGRPQTDREWMIDRGVRPDRADEIIAARQRHTRETGHVYPDMAQPQGSLF